MTMLDVPRTIEEQLTCCFTEPVVGSGGVVEWPDVMHHWLPGQRQLLISQTREMKERLSELAPRRGWVRVAVDEKNHLVVFLIPQDQGGEVLSILAGFKPHEPE